MKRQVHLMYDLICDTVYVYDIFGEQSNLLLKENIFSLKQLRETKDGALIKFLEEKYNIIDRHMKSCGVIRPKYINFRPAAKNRSPVSFAIMKSKYRYMI